ncbi:MAG TPA: PIN domain-containing protein [Halieaceae bacterium]|nr:MAG: VapC toxin family PIN domain ribonuclease [Gammaproteobacteria bacterium]HDY82577.1 PIN domain-containing protein [Halieaceae bacterium]
MTVVVDASVLVSALVDTGSEGVWAESLVADETLVAPELVMVETINILRRLELAGEVLSLEAELSQRDLMRLDIQLFPFSPFANRIWALRNNITSYDAWYVALAEALGCPLATLDQKLVRATGANCTFTTL